MSYESDRSTRSPLIGDLAVGSERGTDAPDREPVPALIELNALYPGGLEVVRDWFEEYLWRASYAQWSGADLPMAQAGPTTPGLVAPPGLLRVSAQLYKCVLTRWQLRAMVEWDRHESEVRNRPPAIFKVWPDYELRAQIDRSAPTVKADAAWRSYGALGRGVVWAVVDSGIDARHGHFSSLELSAEVPGMPVGAPGPLTGRTTGLHRDFRYLVTFPGAPPPDPESPLTDEQGHGTHVAGIIAGRTPAGARQPMVAASREPPPGRAYVLRPNATQLSGMAPECELVSLKVLRRNAQGDYITSSSAVIAALDYLHNSVNAGAAVLRVHGVNISLGCQWAPTDYAAGQSPLCQTVNQLVDSGVAVVVSAGNSGGGTDAQSANPVTALGSITEPAHAQECIAVGSTHREAPHAFGVTWNSSKGPTLDGRMKPDVVAPGEWISSAASGGIRARSGLPEPAPGESGYLTYAEQSGTSMAAPHVSGVIAAFLSARPEFIGRPRQVKQLLMASSTDLGRERYAQGCGLVDLMRMLSSV